MIDSQESITQAWHKRQRHHIAKVYSLTLTMTFTMLIAFFDFLSDLVYVFYTENWVSSELQYIVQGLFLMNVAVNLSALLTAIHRLRKLVAERYKDQVNAMNAKASKTDNNNSTNNGNNFITPGSGRGRQLTLLAFVLGAGNIEDITPGGWEIETPGGDLSQSNENENETEKDKDKEKGKEDSKRKKNVHTEYPYVYVIKQALNKNCGSCVGSALYPIVWCFYMILLCIISIFLGLTKLIAIQQVQEWWMSWIVYDYANKIEKNKKSEEHKNELKKSLNSNSNDSKKKDLNKRDEKAEKKENSKEKRKKEKKKNLAIVDEENKWLGYEVVDDSLLWKIYLWIDHKTPHWLLKYKVNADLYNTYFISELIVESLPQLMMYVCLSLFLLMYKFAYVCGF